MKKIMGWIFCLSMCAILTAPAGAVEEVLSPTGTEGPRLVTLNPELQFPVPGWELELVTLSGVEGHRGPKLVTLNPSVSFGTAKLKGKDPTGNQTCDASFAAALSRNRLKRVACPAALRLRSG